MSDYKGKNPARLISEIEYDYGLEPGTLGGRKKSSHVFNARREAVLQMREMGLSFKEIGVMLQRDHTTIVHIFNGPKKAVTKAKKKLT